MTASLDRDVLAGVPEDARGRRCICARCGRRAAAEPNDEPAAT